jgi:hypothetical protein
MLLYCGFAIKPVQSVMTFARNMRPEVTLLVYGKKKGTCDDQDKIMHV